MRCSPAFSPETPSPAIDDPVSPVGRAPLRLKHPQEGAIDGAASIGMDEPHGRSEHSALAGWRVNKLLKRNQTAAAAGPLLTAGGGQCVHERFGVRRQIRRATGGNEVSVHDDRFVEPDGAGVLHIVTDAGGGGYPAAA